MARRMTTDELWNLMDSLTDDPTRRGTVEAIYDLARNYEDARDRLRDMMIDLAGVLNEAATRLAACQLPNSLGVLQGNGVAIDRLCGEVARLHEAQISAQRLLRLHGIC